MEPLNTDPSESKHDQTHGAEPAQDNDSDLNQDLSQGTQHGSNLGTSLSQVKLIRDGVMLKLTGSKNAGRRLLEGFRSEDEDLKVIAGMMLVQAGDKAVPILAEAVDKGDNLKEIFVLLWDVAAETRSDVLIEKIEGLKSSSDPELAKQATEAYKELTEPPTS